MSDPTTPDGSAVPAGLHDGADGVSGPALPVVGRVLSSGESIIRLGCYFASDGTVVWLCLTYRVTADGTERYDLYHIIPGLVIGNNPCPSFRSSEIAECVTFDLTDGGTLQVVQDPYAPMYLTGSRLSADMFYPGLLFFGLEQIFGAVAKQAPTATEESVGEAHASLVRSLTDRGSIVHIVDPGSVDITLDRMDLAVTEHMLTVSRSSLQAALDAAGRFEYGYWAAVERSATDRLLAELETQGPGVDQDPCDVPAWCITFLRRHLALDPVTYELRYRAPVAACDPVRSIIARLQSYLDPPVESPESQP